MQPLIEIELESPDGHDRLIAAACTLGPEDMRSRLAEWAAVRDRSTHVRRVPGGVAIGLGFSDSTGAVGDLVERESACCGFYSFTLTVDGATRELIVSAGPGREAAVDALLSL